MSDILIPYCNCWIECAKPLRDVRRSDTPKLGKFEDLAYECSCSLAPAVGM
jgi:hypothetical protein